MKQYVFDQLRVSDYEKIGNYLDECAEKGELEGIYWITVPQSLYTDLQNEHVQCQPYHFAANLSLNKVEFELLIRSKQVMRCNCIAYATPEQRDYLIGFADKMLDELKIKL